MARGRNSIIFDDIMVQSKLKSGNHTVSDLRLENSVCHDHLLYKHSITTKHSTRHSENYWFMVKLGHHDINKTIFCQDIDLKMTYGKSQQWRHWFQNDILEGPPMEALISKWQNIFSTIRKPNIWCCKKLWSQNGILLEGPPMGVTNWYWWPSCNSILQRQCKSCIWYNYSGQEKSVILIYTRRRFQHEDK